jgi:hypothetical protein
MKYFKYIFTIFVSFVLFSCAKESIITDKDFQKNLLAGTGNYQNTTHVWKLDSLTISGAAYKLSANEKAYTKTFSRLGSYVDSDGYAGTWELTTDNKLDITTINALTSVKTKNVYDVVVLNAAQLQLKITGTKGVYVYFFIIAN